MGYTQGFERCVRLHIISECLAKIGLGYSQGFARCTRLNIKSDVLYVITKGLRGVLDYYIKTECLRCARYPETFKNIHHCI